MGRFLALLSIVWAFSLPCFADGHLAEEKIRASAQAWSDLYAKRDLKTLMKLYHPKARLFTNGQPALLGPDAIQAYFQSNFDTSKSAKIDFKIEDITVFDDTATLVSLYKMDIDTGKGTPLTFVGRSMLVYKRDAFGNWLLFADMDNLAPDATVETFTLEE